MDGLRRVTLGIESFRPGSSLIDPGSQQTNFGGSEPLALEWHHQAGLEPTDQTNHETLRALPRLEGGPRDSSPGCHGLHIPAQLVLLLTRPVAGVTLAGQKGTNLFYEIHFSVGGRRQSGAVFHAGFISL